MTVYVISDTHFGDTADGIIAFEQRPFKSREDMIESLIKSWNKVVKPDDEVFHLGDVFYGLTFEERQTIVKSLNGHKYLVLGNHDRDHSMHYWLSLGFEKTYDYPIVYNNFIILSHEPLYMSNGPYVNIYGHVHGNPTYKDVSYLSYCACVERTGYKPVLMSSVLDRIKLEREKLNG